MKPIRAIIFGIFLWLLVFLTISALKFSFGIKFPEDIYYLVYFIFFIMFTLMCFLGYFFTRRTKGGFLQGVSVALTFLVLFIVLHLIIIVPFITENINFIWRIDTLISYIVVLVIGILVGLSRR
jgi:hypothetical protein